MGSLYEIQMQLEIAKNLNYLPTEQFEILFENSREIERMLSSLIQKLKIKNNTKIATIFLVIGLFITAYLLNY